MRVKVRLPQRFLTANEWRSEPEPDYLELEVDSAEQARDKVQEMLDLGMNYAQMRQFIETEQKEVTALERMFNL
jgi:hypothetical protein